MSETDVDVAYDNFQVGSLATDWPKRIRRPFDIPAHIWRTEKLELEAK